MQMEAGLTGAVRGGVSGSMAELEAAQGCAEKGGLGKAHAGDEGEALETAEALDELLGSLVSDG